jgi:uncharacterized protein (TIGR02145 family)
MNNQKRENLKNKRNMPHALCGPLCFFALLFCGCTDVPENCGNYVLRDPITKECLPSTDPNRPMYTVTVDAGDGAIGAGRYSEREVVDIFAGTPEDGQRFKYWTTSNDGVKFNDANNATTTFKMPAGNVTVTAVFEGTSGPVTPPPTDTTAPPIKPTKYAVTVSSEGKDATGGGDYVAGDTVTIYAGTAPDGKQFKNWTSSSDDVVFAATDSATTTFVMPAKSVAVIALFEGVSGPVAPTKYEVTIVSAGTGATGGGSYAAGDMVTVSAGTAPSGQYFTTWVLSSGRGVEFDNANSATTTFIMPANAVTVVPVFETKYTVTVSSPGTGATGSGNYAAGYEVKIYAGAPLTGRQFKNWTTVTGGVNFADENNPTTTFIMPAKEVSVTANFEVASTPPPTPPDNTLKDSRDNQTYGTVVIGSKTWMAKNLNYATKSDEGDSWCYENSTANCYKYGRLYTWEAAMKACPSGWRLPDTADWNKLVAAGGHATAGKKLKSKSGWNNNGNGTDDFGFSALPGGARYRDGKFYNVGGNGRWWTATARNSDDAYYRRMGDDDDYVGEDNDNKSYGLSVRCIKD